MNKSIIYDKVISEDIKRSKSIDNRDTQGFILELGITMRYSIIVQSHHDVTDSEFLIMRG